MSTTSHLVRPSVRTLVLGVGLALGALVAATTAAGASPKLPDPVPIESMSRSEVDAVCHDEGDVAYGTGASTGDYGCLNGDGTTINCSGSGDCTWTPSGRVVRSPGTKGSAVPITPVVPTGLKATRTDAAQMSSSTAPSVVLAALRSVASSASTAS